MTSLGFENLKIPIQALGAPPHFDYTKVTLRVLTLSLAAARRPVVGFHPSWRPRPRCLSLRHLNYS
jgi:hypothetical protein